MQSALNVIKTQRKAKSNYNEWEDSRKDTNRDKKKHDRSSRNNKREFL